MSKEARSGEMRTQIIIQKQDSSTDAQGFQKKQWTSLFEGKPAWCKWVNPHGIEVYEQMRLNLNQPATITMRYAPQVDVRCRVFKEYVPTGKPDEDDPQAYSILSIDNVQDERKIMEIKVARVVKA